ncbi:amidohydrolase family protein [Myxococcota bacterium]|nr:amidohydrolase family protein [Myxococcota bacterium]MCZ7617469.1 amidohydrolase family protein [Myxococcota bacterium]
MLITGAELEGTAPLDVRLASDRIAEIGRSLARRRDEPVLDAAGGALLPGLHDHHLHLFALAAARASVRCGPPAVCDAASLAVALATGRATGDAGAWIRGVDYFESVAGELRRAELDRLVPGQPLRIQHRSGALWLLNSAAIDRLGLDRGADAPGVERDAAGRATGRLFHLDTWLRERLEPQPLPNLGAVGALLASFGVTGVTDATPDNGPAELRAFADACDRAELRQRVLVMGTPGLPASTHALVERGAVKLRLDESAFPDFDELVRRMDDAHRGGRPVALHCVTRAELVLAAGALEAAGALPGDRIEHASVTPPDVLRLLAELGVRVVTQPGFVRERGDAYAEHVDAADRPWLYRGRGFLDAAVPLAAGTDAPYGDPDPWLAMQAAVERRTRSGRLLGAGECLSPEAALALFTSPPDSPGAAPRRVAIGARADLCLLDQPWSEARERLSSACVTATIRSGCVVWRRAEVHAVE